MSPSLACPDPREIQRLAQGDLAEPEAQTLASHILACTTCAERLNAACTNDPVAVSLRAGWTPVLAASPSADALIARMLHTPLFSTNSSEDSGTHADGAPKVGERSSDAIACLSPPQQPDEIGRLGSYRVLKKLGAGGMGIVLLAEDSLLRRKVALKMMLPSFALNPQAKERFLREARSAAAIEHPHIVPIYQVGEDQGIPFLAMPFLQGESLETRLGREHTLPPPEAIRIAAEMALGLSAAHAKGLIHRDIKPGNVWLEVVSGGAVSGECGNDAPGSTHHSPLTTHHSPTHVKLLDFGLARPEHGEGAALTQTGAIVGTPAFMSPEQARGHEVDGRSDLFSLGCVLYVMLTGRRPFPGESTMSILSALAVDTPPAPRALNPEVPPALSDLTMRLLAKKPEERPASAHAVVEALRALEASPQPGSAETRRRRPVLLGIAAAVLLTVLGGGGYWRYQIIIIRDREGKEVARLKVPDGGSVEMKPGKDRKKDGGPPTGVPPLPDPWFAGVAALPAEQQVEAVAAKMRERNPGFDGKLYPTFENGVVIGLSLEALYVKDLAPMAALPGLRTLWCGGSDPFGKIPSLTELSSLRGIKLMHLNVGSTPVADLAPLRGMELTSLNCYATKVTNLSPLEGMKLTSLAIDMTKVSDLSPLQGMKLTDLTINETNVSDLLPLKGMKLTRLDMANTLVTDLAPLRGMPLTRLSLGSRKLRDSIPDLSPLQGMPLTDLTITYASLSDLSALKGLKLIRLTIRGGFNHPLTITDLSPLKDMPLTDLIITGAANLTDLSPLKGMRLTVLDFSGAAVTDLSPLQGMPLREIFGNFRPERDGQILRAIKTLQKINHKPAAEFLKDVADKP